MLIIGLIAMTTFIIIHTNNYYMEYKDRKCVVLDKLTTNGGYKSSGNFYLVLKEERGIKFDIIVSPTTYSQAKKNEIIHFNLRQFDIKQTSRENIIYFFGTVITGAIGFICLFAVCCDWIARIMKKN